VQYSSIPGRTSGPTLRIYTHNIFGRQADWERRREVLETGIAALDPDILLLQETIVDNEYDQVADILGDGYHVVHSTVRETNGSGVSIASRWPISDVRELDLRIVSPRTDEFACTTLIVGVDAPPPLGPMRIANHFPDYQPEHEYERERQTVLAARALESMHSSEPTHIVLAGDLDAELDAASLRFLSGRQSLDGMSVCYRNAWDQAHPGAPGHTFTSRNPLIDPGWPFQQIDHIFIRCGDEGRPTLRIAACELAFAEPLDGVWASDHFGLVADLAIPAG
jgi:endonuclease/exonuclease/phosphatase family metal-dependent hydrolase